MVPLTDGENVPDRQTTPLTVRCKNRAEVLNSVSVRTKGNVDKGTLTEVAVRSIEQAFQVEAN